MPIAHAQITMPWTDTSVQGPQSVNNLYIDTGVTPITSLGMLPVGAAIETLFAEDLLDLWSPNLSGVGLVSIYDLSDPPERIPVHTREFSFTPASPAGVPTEVAVNVAYRANYESGVSRRKFRGRNYLGPLGVGEDLWTTDGHLTSAICDTVAAAYLTFAGTINATDDYVWVCGSEANDWKRVDRIEVKNELATIGRRQNSVTYTAVETVP